MLSSWLNTPSTYILTCTFNSSVGTPLNDWYIIAFVSKKVITSFNISSLLTYVFSSELLQLDITILKITNTKILIKVLFDIFIYNHTFVYVSLENMIVRNLFNNFTKYLSICNLRFFIYLYIQCTFMYFYYFSSRKNVPKSSFFFVYNSY